MTGQDGVEISQRSLWWGLERLCLWGELDGKESADPHVRGEAAASAKITIDQLAYEISQEENPHGE